MDRFIKGPIPLAWIVAAGRLPGRALHVALALRYLVGLCGTHTVRLSRTTWEPFGVERTTAYRALAALERHGLVVVERRRGASPLVTVLEVEPPAETTPPSSSPPATGGPP